MKTETILNKMRSKITKGQEWMVDNIQYLTLMGSHAYGTHHQYSDFDVYGFTIPPMEYVFPNNLIWGYDSFPNFNQFQGQFKEGPKQEHLDFQIYNITKYFRLVFDNNPNMIDSLFTPDNCVLIETELATLVREHRNLFLHKGAWHKFKGYAFSQLNKIKTNPEDKQNPERKQFIQKYGYEVKFAVHIFRLLDEIEQILTNGTIILGRNRAELKLILKGFYSLQEIHDKFKVKELELETLYSKSTLPHGQDTHKDEIRNLLITCLTRYYGLQPL